MALLTLRNLSEDVYRVLCVRAARRGRSVEAEVCATLEEAVLLEGRGGLGSLLTAIGRRAALSDEEVAAFAQRNKAPTQPLDLE